MTGFLHNFAKTCRLVAASLTARFWPGRDTRDVLDVLEARSVDQQALWVSLVLLGLFGASLIAAQFGAVGLGVFFLAVVAAIR